MQLRSHSALLAHPAFRHGQALGQLLRRQQNGGNDRGFNRRLWLAFVQRHVQQNVTPFFSVNATLCFQPLTMSIWHGARRSSFRAVFIGDSDRRGLPRHRAVYARDGRRELAQPGDRIGGTLAHFRFD